MPEKEISPTIYGIETEYSLMLKFPGDVVHEIVGECHSVDAKLGLYQQPKKAGGSKVASKSIDAALASIGIVRNQYGMLSNGGRFYLDPSGPEYDTAEHTTAEGAVHAVFEGDKILLDSLEHLRKSRVLEGYQANRRIVDHNRTSRGIHLNTAASINEDSVPHVFETLQLLNVAKGAIFGSGGLLVDKDGSTSFHHSPRLSVTSCSEAPYTEYTKRPLVRFPFKPDGDGLWRVETVTSDALNFAWPLRASLVMTNALVHLLELRRTEDIPFLKDPVNSAIVVGRYGNEFPVATLDTYDRLQHVYPLDIIRGLGETMLKVDELEDYLDEESRQVIPEVIDVADKMSKDIYSCMDQVESVSRLYAIERRMEKKRLSIDSERLCKFDYFWDLIDGGAAEHLRQAGKGWLGFASNKSLNPSKADLSTPPSDTRAKLRGEAILVNGAGNESNWGMIDFGNFSQYVPPLVTERPLLTVPQPQD